MFQAIKEKIINENSDETPLDLAEFSEVAFRYINRVGDADPTTLFVEQEDDHENIVRLTLEILAQAVYKFDKTTKRDYRSLYKLTISPPTLSKQGYDEFLLLYPTIYAWAAELLNTVYEICDVSEYYKCHATQEECVWMNDRYECHLCEEKHYEIDTIANHNHCDKCRCASAITFQKIFRGLNVRWKDYRCVWLLGQKS